MVLSVSVKLLATATKISSAMVTDADISSQSATTRVSIRPAMGMRRSGPGIAGL